MLQFLPAKPERMRGPDFDPGDAPDGMTPHQLPEDEAWVEGRSLIETVTDIELIDPELSSERLLYRLFHERGVRVFSTQPVQSRCSCSRASVKAMLESFPQEDRDHMVENGGDFGDLRVLQFEIRVCARGCRRAPGQLIDGPLTVRTIERESRDVDVEPRRRFGSPSRRYRP